MTAQGGGECFFADLRPTFGKTGFAVLIRLRRRRRSPGTVGALAASGFTLAGSFGETGRRGDFDGDWEAGRVTAFVAGRDAAPAFTTSAYSLNGGFTLARSPGVLFLRLSWPRNKL